MSRAVFGCLVAAALAIGLAFRVAGLDVRPMHHDEANQAVKFGALLETGDYRYDRNDHHGPTLYYLTLPSAWLRGQSTLPSLDERTLRLVPALCGAALILLLPLLAPGLGRAAVAAAAFLVALSPGLTYYSRFYIQETIFVFFALGFLVTLGRGFERPGARWAALAGFFAGLAYATKETSAIVLPAAVIAALVARAWTRASEPSQARHASASGVWPAVAHVVLGLAVALLVALLFFSSFLRHPSGLIESFRAFGIYLGRGIEAGPHAHPWYYYLRLLAYSSSGGLVWTEALVLVLALVGLVATVIWPRPCRDHARPAGLTGIQAAFWPRYVALYSILTAAAFSAVRYKTPWNLLPFYAGFVLLAGYGAVWIVQSARPRVVRAIAVVALAAACCHLAVENWRAGFRYPADPRNPYVYAQTTPDFLRLVQRVADLAAVHPDRTSMLIKVVAGPSEQWPLPWYLRKMTRVGYWARAADALTPDEAPVIVASQDSVAALDAALGERYVSEFYGLRPGVLLTVYVERGMWERFLKSSR